MITSKRLQIKRLENEVKKFFPAAERPARLFIKEKPAAGRYAAIDHNDNYTDIDGNDYNLEELRAIEKAGTECIIIIIGVSAIEQAPDYDLQKLSDDELEQLETILTKAEGRDETAAAAVKAVI